MSLPASYLEYDKRRKGMDHDLYPWSNMFERQPVSWANNKKVATWIVIDLEWFPITPNAKPFRAPGHMQTAYPDYRHYTSRDYGSRIGVYRLLDALKKVNAKASIAMNSAIAERYPELAQGIVNDGHEIIAHSTDMNAAVATGVDLEVEKKYISESISKLEEITGQKPAGWLSIARSQSFNTPSLLAEAGLKYMCDWVNDELPYDMETPSGSIHNIPLNHELSDRQIINVQQHSVDSYVEQIQDAWNWLHQEAGRFGGRMLPLNLTPYIMGLPYRMDAFERLLTWLSEQPDNWFATGQDILEATQR